MDTKVAPSSAYVGDDARVAIPANRFNLSGIDHVGIACRNPDLAGTFVEQILGGIEIYRAGYSAEDRGIGRLRHIFYHVGAQLVEVVELSDERGYADQCNPDSNNTNPHWAFGATPEDLAKFIEHLKQEGIPFSGPRSHHGTSVVSVYFRDCEGNNLEVTTWKPFGPELMTTTPMDDKHGFIPWRNLSHNWRPKASTS
jgi:catechol 2,3-dioxygenase-like lactoylglutathione lyase family enzyme